MNQSAYPHLAGTSQEVQIMKLANYNQLEKFLIDNISDFHFGLLLCMHTGIRVGELSGLRWEDVDSPSTRSAYSGL